MARGSCAILWAGGPAGWLPGISCWASEAKKARELTQSRATEPCAVVRYRATPMHDLAKAGRRYGTGMVHVNEKPCVSNQNEGTGMARDFLLHFAISNARYGTNQPRGYGTSALCQSMARGMARSAVPYPGTGSDRAFGAIPFEKNRCHIYYIL